MDLAAVHTMYEALAGPGTCFIYSGPFHDALTARLIDLGETVLEEEDAPRGHRGRLGFVMVEAYQNIVRHRAHLPAELAQGRGRSLFLMRTLGAGHEVVAMNPVPVAEEGSLRDLLQRLRGLDARQLKEMFLSGLRTGERTGRGGAGLGLIEMARRSGNGLRHQLVAVDQQHRLFTLQVAVDGDKQAALPPERTAALHAWVAGDDVQLCCMGRLGPGLQQALLAIIASDPDEGPGHGHARQRAWLAASGLLDALNRQGGNALMMLAGRDAARVLVLGVPMSHAEADALAAMVKELGQLDHAALRARYRDALLGRDARPVPATLGLLELLRHAAGPLCVHRQPHGEGTMLYVEAPI